LDALAHVNLGLIIQIPGELHFGATEFGKTSQAVLARFAKQILGRNEHLPFGQ